ncbi:hypothetical protein BX616_005432 [Lobosporangium transversale]|nr:hypothetical protein BX616_005432 [Lobosporangium transversale]
MPNTVRVSIFFSMALMSCLILSICKSVTAQAINRTAPHFPWTAVQGPPSFNSLNVSDSADPDVNYDNPILFVRFWEHHTFKGRCVRCPVVEYQRCYSLKMKVFGFDEASSLIFENMIPESDTRHTALTLYQGDHCNGAWNRDSGYWPQLWLKFAKLGFLIDTIHSFKVAGAAEPPGSGHKEAGDLPGEVRNLCTVATEDDCNNLG